LNDFFGGTGDLKHISKDRSQNSEVKDELDHEKKERCDIANGNFTLLM